MNSRIILELTSANISGTLKEITQAGIEIVNVTEMDALTVRFETDRRDVDMVQDIANRRGERIRQIQRLGIYWRITRVVNHWVLIAGIAALLLLTAWLPSRILFIQVQGNEEIPVRLILERAGECGIVFGADRGAVRSEQVKNALLEALPELQWAGINTAGCVATITVEERQPLLSHDPSVPGNLVATQDGIILEVITERGTAVAKVGQAVCKGEILISGYTDCGGVILYQGAQGEVYARTRHLISAKTPDDRHLRVSEIGRDTKISLVIGKKRINFYEDSGILDTGCVKMYSEYYLVLPGGLRLPVKMVVETQIRYECVEKRLGPQEGRDLLSRQATDYLQTQMIAGKIMTVEEAVDGYDYFGNFVCREMIGRLVHEEITTDYGENRRTNGERGAG